MSLGKMEKILIKRGVAEILSFLYLKGKATCYQIAKNNSMRYGSVHRHIKELEATGIICYVETKISKGRVNKLYTLTSTGKERYKAFQEQKIKNILKDAQKLGLNLDKIIAAALQKNLSS